MEENRLMRTQTGWLALLVTAGMVMAPMSLRADDFDWTGQLLPAAPAIGQEPQTPAASFELVPPPPPPFLVRGQIGGPPLDYDVPAEDHHSAFPVPLYHDRPETGGFFAAAEFIFFRQTNPIGNQVLAVRGLVDTDGSILAALGGPAAVQTLPCQQLFPGCGLVGNFIGSAQPALNANSAGGETYSPGYRVTLGYRFAEGYEIELNYAWTQDNKMPGGATLAAPGFQLGPLLANSFMFSPVFNFPPLYSGPANKVGVGNPLAAYGIWNGASEEDTVMQQHYSEFNLGGRVPIVEDECNRCYGLVGARQVWLWEVFKWRVVSYDNTGFSEPEDVALYSNIVSNPMWGVYAGAGWECYLGHGFSLSLDATVAGMVDFVREISRYELGDFSTESKRARREWTIVPAPKAALNAYWYPIPGVEIRAGYDFEAFFNTISSPQPVPFDFASPYPVYVHQPFRMVDGWSAGIAFIF